MAKQPKENKSPKITSDSLSETVSEQFNTEQELMEDLKRVQAEFVNFKRRAEEEKKELLNFAKNRVVKEFLAVRDNFDRELANRPSTIDADWAKGIDSVRQQFDQVLKSQGVEKFESLGREFDPRLHEAISHEGIGDIVTTELQAGYMMAGNVLRHAMVKVGGAVESSHSSINQPDNNKS